MSKARILSQEFYKDLSVGLLRPLLDRIKSDDTLMLALRDGYINIYYRGGSILNIAETQPSHYEVIFNEDYNKSLKAIPKFPQIVINPDDVANLTAAIPGLKEVMDRYFSATDPGGKRKPEREFQQLVARENNRSPISNETEYFIVDIEVSDSDLNARFDMLAVRWLRTERKKQGSLVPVLIEMKYGTNAFGGASGILKHLKDVGALVRDSNRWNSVLDSLEEQINQLADLELLNFNRSKSVKRLVVDRDVKPEFIFLLANHNPASTKLATILEEINESDEAHAPYSLLFFISSFAGYGMHRACMSELADFKATVARLFDSASRSSREEKYQEP
jgi:hypothetical protein